MINQILLKGSLVLLLVFSQLSPLRAQDFKQAMVNLRKRYETIEKLHAVMSIKVFTDSTSKKPIYNEQADIKRDGKKYVYHFGSQRMLMNWEYLVMVDGNAHEIVFSKRDVKGEDDFFDKDPIKMNMDSLFNIYSEAHYLGRKDEVDHYRILQKQGLIGRVDMMVDTKNNVLRSIGYRYRSGQDVKIDFVVFDMQPEFTQGTFDENVYMVVENGKFKAATAYKDFTIQEVKN